MSSVTHEEIQESLGAYALDAVDPDEALAISAHLFECPECLAEADAHRAVASHLDDVCGRMPLPLHVEPPASSAPPASSRSRTSPLIIALLGVAAAGHAAAVPHHIDAAHGGAVTAVAFVLVALAQTYWAVRLARKRTTNLELAVAGSSLFLIAIWVVSRTMGVPFGPHSGAPEAVGVLDASATAAHIGLAALLVRARWILAGLAVGALSVGAALAIPSDRDVPAAPAADVHDHQGGDAHHDHP